MVMLNDSRTDDVKKYLMYNTSNMDCAVIKVETMTAKGVSLLVKEANGNKGNGDFSVSVYLYLAVTNPNNTVPSDCNETYAKYVTGTNQTIYTTDCQSSSGNAH
nr:uncharacterized protein LOC129385358 [Dermacentor andersoni]